MTREALLVRPEGPVPYGLANEAMHGLAERRLAGEVPDVVILLEHHRSSRPGAAREPDELLWSPDELAARGAPRSTGSTAVGRSRSTDPASWSATRSSTSGRSPMPRGTCAGWRRR